MNKKRNYIKLNRLRNSIIGLSCVSSFFLGGFISRQVDEQKITIAMVKNAQKIIGLEFTDAEADSMLETLETRRKNYGELRKLKMPNAVAPALNFNPLPAGYEFPDKISGFKTAVPSTFKLEGKNDELAYKTIPQLAHLIRTKQISSVELTQFFIDRLRKYDPILEHTITITEMRAMTQARKVDAEIAAGKYRGVLHGIPFGAKDLLATKDYKTTWGSVPYKDQTIETDATVITFLEKAGAVLIAKMTLGELAQGDVWFGGKTKNPWDIKRGSSGSSAGSASAVAAGCLPFAIGSETYGSIVSPSAECGTTGLRPTFGRISKYGAMALSWSMDKLGPIARNVEDCAIVFKTIHGPDGKDLSVIPAPFNYSSGGSGTLKGVRIGYIKSEFSRKSANSLNDSLTLVKLTELGAILVPFEMPALPYVEMSIALSAEAGAAFDELTLTNREDMMVNQNKGARPNALRASRFIPAVEYIQANRARTLLIEQLNQKMKDFDAFIAPAFGLNLRVTNLSGHPCVVLPNGFRNGLPGSITFTGQLFGEGKLLQIARAYQIATGFNDKHPELNF
ncbi:amidase [Daejeonella lutea]|uniref:Asp-tRNAAsn/Glu-tRNAGln amidotransferase A subunit n=1 Tax=Daejeonella lutea TaxID=572036 RepID=A0A1T5DT86_9SPHI|nr:amidase [Daejeonella lutea]SKB74881.1 Asp-tRNAAsn/Glu-tRNAGln amidotransferase A subunit [Daejeonella lutea]